MNKYKAIGFDWGGVINGKPGKFFGADVSKLLGIPQSKYLEVYFKYNKRVNRGVITWKELWTLVLSDLGQVEKVNALTKLSKSANAYQANKDMLRLVDKLKTNGYKVGLMSNNTHEKAAEMRQHGLDKRFDVFHISSETGYVKPELDAFAHFAKALGVNLNELVYIDDSSKSLSTAELSGYTPILFSSYKKLLKQLNDIGVKS